MRAKKIIETYHSNIQLIFKNTSWNEVREYNLGIKRNKSNSFLIEVDFSINRQ